MKPAPVQPYYIHAPRSLHDADQSTVQLHMLCHQLNRAGYAAYLSGAPVVNGDWWTPMLCPQTMAAHYLAGLVPIAIQEESRGEFELPGLQVQMVLASQSNDPGYAQPRFISTRPGQPEWNEDALRLALPWFDPALLERIDPSEQRSGALVYSGRLPGPGFTLRPEHAGLRDVSPHAALPLGTRERWQALGTAQVLFAYAAGSIVTEARLLGCQVVYVANDHQLQRFPGHDLDTWGVAANSLDRPLDARAYSPAMFRQHVAQLLHDGPALLNRFIAATQAAAAALQPAQGWQPRHLHAVEPLLPAAPEERARRADEQATEALCKAYALWKTKAAPSEVHSDICAELVGSGVVRPPTVHLFARGRSAESIADTLDSLGAGWLQPRCIVVHADIDPPCDPAELGEGLHWSGPSGSASANGMPGCDDEWTVLLDAGTRLEPYSLIELLASAAGSAAQVVYAAHDVALSEEQHLPHFSGGANLEWLRGTNYLGGVVVVRTAAWLPLPDRWHYACAYRLALRASATHGAAALHYVDQVLSHSPPHLASGQEAQEFTVAQQELEQAYPGATLAASELVGCWVPQYPDPGSALTLLVPTGKQPGYLRSLLLSCVRMYASGTFKEALLLAQDEDLASMQQFVGEWQHAEQLPLRLLATGCGSYNHARSLNIGLRAARTELVLVCDDDVELLDGVALPALRRLFTQKDIAIAAPRLVLQHGETPTVLAGPQVAGNDAMLHNYVGVRQGIAERGHHNRLQMAQDVAGVHGACWLGHRDAILAVGGLDEANTPLFQTMTDLGYRLQQSGWRLVWTPRANVLHAGGATLRLLRRDPIQALALSQAALREQHHMRARWLDFVGSLTLYSKHLRGDQPYVLDVDLVCRWRHDYRMRPRVLAQPLSSGSGQYRVIEPLDALQMHSLAETCAVTPPKAGVKMRRILNALDISRLKPDRVLVQHSILDEDIANLRAIRDAHPDVFLVQLVDDLTSELPAAHPNHAFGQREGHTRMVQALNLSDRLVVSTQPLADYYRQYCPDVHVVPNALDPHHWGGLAHTERQSRERLRLGWAGAAQHLGDLRLVASVVRALAPEVDWIFMGMCPDELRPYIKEFHPFVSYKDYPAKLASLDLDIAIAPLEDNPFNACKSNLRLLEYGAMGWPVVCSDVYPFRTANPPVLRVPNDEQAWLSALRRLMDDPQLRRAQGHALHEWLQRNFLLEHHVEAWRKALLH